LLGLLVLLVLYVIAKAKTGSQKLLEAIIKSVPTLQMDEGRGKTCS
jgi:hypothetical protein